MNPIKVMVNGIPGKMAQTVAGYVLNDNRYQLVAHSLTGPEITAAEHVIVSAAVRLIRPDTVDLALARADAWLFGVQPTLWLQDHLHPLLTDYLALSYMTYFVFPPILAG